MSNEQDPELLVVLNQPTDPLALIQKTQQQQAQALEEISAQLNNLNQRPLKITDFNMPFGSLVGFMVKAAIASIPAAIIVLVLYFVTVILLGIFGVMLVRH